MEMNARELKAFEDFCQVEFRALFGETTQSVTTSLNTIVDVQKSMISNVGKVSEAIGGNAHFESIRYSFFSGGKRFRPMLSFACATYLDLPIERVFPWAMAIEMIHTYSLIHDDLPCMDNDDFRRGQPTNHKVYGEAMALLAGDSLLTEAFAVLAKYYSDSGPSLGALVKQLAHVSGLNGMILGQYYDMTLNAPEKTLEKIPDKTPEKTLESTLEKTQKKAIDSGSASSIAHLNQIHLLKTGALIAGAFTGPALLKNMNADQLKSMRDVGLLVGYAFQVKDDILDAQQDKESPKNLIYHFKETVQLAQFLERVHHEIKSKISDLDKQLKCDEGKSRALTRFLEWNINRDK